MQHAYEMTADLDFHDDGYIELVLRILGLMCDNQHHDIQDYLREQPDNIKSVNLVAETTRFLNILYSNINDKSMALIVQLFDTLVEFTSVSYICLLIFHIAGSIVLIIRLCPVPKLRSRSYM